MAIENLINDDLKSSSYLGKVIDNNDPDFEGKIKIKVFGKFDQMPDSDIPWARPLNRSTGGSKSGGGYHSVPKVDCVVGVKFENGDIHEPEYFYMQHISDELKAEIQGSYKNAHALLYDTETDGSVKLFFTEEKGLMLDYKQSQVNIKPDKSIIIQTASKNSIIEILDDGTMNITQSSNVNIKCGADAKVDISGKADITTGGVTTLKCSKLIVNHSGKIELGAGAKEKVVLGNTFMAFFNSHTHIGNLGVPTSPPIMPMTTSQLSQKNVTTL